mgnify:FL=1
MSVVMARIDNRLLHGIIVTQWAPVSGATRVMVIDDKVAGDEVLKSTMRMARPAGMAVSIISEQTALKNFAAGKYDREKVFVIAKEPETMLRLVESGVELPSLVVGGSLVKEDGIQLTQRAYASAENVQSYKALIARGVKVTAQFVPADKPVSVADSSKGGNMVNFTILQVVLLTLLAFIKHVDYYGIPMIFVNYAVFWGLITGVVMGDWKTGLVIGGTIQLMQLGVAGFGGSSIPDYGTMAIIATAYGVTLGSDTGLAIGLPVGMLGIQLDVVAKILNGFVVEKSQKFCNEGKFNQMNAILWVCPALFGLCAALPVFVSVTLGQPAVNWLLEVMPQWFLSGLTLAGKMLPAVGIAMLLRYMPTAKYFQYLLAGFFLSAFLNVPIIGAAIVGVALAIAFYQRAERDTELAAHASADAFIGEDE